MTLLNRPSLKTPRHSPIDFDGRPYNTLTLLSERVILSSRVILHIKMHKRVIIKQCYFTKKQVVIHRNVG